MFLISILFDIETYYHISRSVNKIPNVALPEKLLWKIDNESHYLIIPAISTNIKKLIFADNGTTYLINFRTYEVERSSLVARGFITGQCVSGTRFIGQLQTEGRKS